MASTIMLGEEDITRYLGPEPRKDPGEVETLRRKIRDAEYLTLEAEKDQLAEFRQKLIQELYPRLDVSFLRSHRYAPVGKGEIQVPRFCVYPAVKGNNFSLRIRASQGFISLNLEADVWYNNAGEGYDNKDRQVEGPFKIPLLMATGLFDEGLQIRPFWTQSNKSAREKRELGRRIEKISGTDDLKIMTWLNTTVPREIKEKLRANEFNGGHTAKNNFIIAEKKPHEWGQEKLVTLTPMVVVGVHEGQAYFVDSFTS